MCGRFVCSFPGWVKARYGAVFPLSRQHYLVRLEIGYLAVMSHSNMFEWREIFTRGQLFQ